MKSFAETFFKTFGAQVTAQQGELVVDLPPELAGTFGKTRLYLVFPSSQEERRELSPAEDLVVYGSRTFEQMLALLEQRGEATQLHWPPRLTIDPAKPPVPLPVHNCRVVNRQIKVTDTPFFIFNFRATYLSDEKQEEFLTVALDEQGRPRPELVEMLADLDQSQPPDHPLRLTPALMHPLLVQAGEIARQQIEEQAAMLEQAIQPRLEKALLRLTTYYRRLLAEVDSGEAAQDEAIRAELRQDLARKISDELERHRLQVILTPLNYAVAQLPLARYRFTLATRHSHQELELLQNLHTHQVEPLLCHHCRQPTDHLALCDRGHIVHPDCLDTCRQCERDICLGCGIQICAICERSVCGECTKPCAYCDRWLCAEHTGLCPICGASFCTDHSGSCRWCGQTYCHQCLSNSECQSCRTALESQVVAQFPLPSMPHLSLEGYRWRQARNKAYSIYIGRRTGLLSPLLSWLIVVTDQAGTVVHWQRTRAWDRLLRR